jgi:hypothetical protein
MCAQKGGDEPAFSQPRPVPSIDPSQHHAFRDVAGKLVPSRASPEWAVCGLDDRIALVGIDVTEMRDAGQGSNQLDAV